MMIELCANEFVTYKKGDTSADCQDATGVNKDRDRYAIADGATRSFFPKTWAEILVKGFCEESTLPLHQESWREWIEPLRQKWLEQVTSTVQETKRYIAIDRLSKSESAASTFVGLEVDRGKSVWKAMIIGDSCLFHVSDSKLEKSHLIEKSEGFTNRPDIFASFAKDSLYEPEFRTGQVKTGDILILATDALAKWIIQHEEEGKFNDALKRLIKIEANSEKQFNDFVEEARESDGIRLVNDDVALLLISVESDQQPQKTEFPVQELEQQNRWLVLLVCLLSGFGILSVLYLIFYLLLKTD